MLRPSCCLNPRHSSRAHTAAMPSLACVPAPRACLPKRLCHDADRGGVRRVHAPLSASADILSRHAQQSRLEHAPHRRELNLPLLRSCSAEQRNGFLEAERSCPVSRAGGCAAALAAEQMPL